MIGSSATVVLTSYGLHSGKDPFAEQFKTRSPIRRSLDYLQPVDVPFGYAVGLFVVERGHHCVLVAHQTSSELHHFWQPACPSVYQLGFQCLRLSFPQQEEKGQHKLLSHNHLRAMTPKMLKVLSLIRFQLRLGFQQEPSSLAS
jgi:hypothetical protein